MRLLSARVNSAPSGLAKPQRGYPPQPKRQEERRALVKRLAALPRSLAKAGRRRCSSTDCVSSSGKRHTPGSARDCSLVWLGWSVSPVLPRCSLASSPSGPVGVYSYSCATLSLSWREKIEYMDRGLAAKIACLAAFRAIAWEQARIGDLMVSR